MTTLIRLYCAIDGYYKVCNVLSVHLKNVPETNFAYYKCGGNNVYLWNISTNVL